MKDILHKIAAILRTGFSRVKRISRHFKVRLLLITLFIVAVMLMACFFITYNININVMQNQELRNTLASFQKSEKTLEWFLSNVERVSLSLQLAMPINNFLYNQFDDHIKYVEAKQDLVRQIDTVISEYSYINAIIFFKPNGEMGGSSSPRTYFHTGEHPFYSTYEYQKAATGQTRMTWISGYWRDYFTLHPLTSLNEKDIMIVGLKTIGDQSRGLGGKRKGEPRSSVMLVSIAEPAFRQFFDNLADEGTSVSVLDKNGKQISGTILTQFGEIPPYFSHITANSDFGSFTTDMTEKKSQIIYYRMANTGWLFVKEIPIAIYTTTADTIRNTMLLVFIGALLTIAIVYTLWVLQFSRPFEDLTKSMYAVGQGHLDRKIQVMGGIYEIDLINQAFNEMMNNLNRLIVKNKEMEREKLELEFKNLQAQINPHFIYNTIATIRWTAMLSGAQNVDDALLSFVRLLRPVFNSNRIIWTLREEIEYIENYMELMLLRYGASVNFIISRYTEVEEIEIPRFILQPILENCFEHATGTVNSLNITLTVNQESRRLIIIIEDNGPGIEKDKIRQLNCIFDNNNLDKLYNEEGGHSRIGLYNVNRRLKLRYGANSGLKIDPEFQGGTKIFMCISKNNDNYL